MTDALFGGYRVERELSRRAGSATLLCQDETGQRRVLKTFRDVDADERRRIESRVAALVSLSHPGIARCHGFLTDPGDPGHLAIVHDWIEGQTVAAAIESGRRWTQEELFECLREVLEALEAAHNHTTPVVHRDVKPHNLVRAANRYVLIDFDTARELAADPGTASVVGTTGYAAPEQFVGRATPASDQYGLAATVLHMATHRHPSEFPLKSLRIDLSATELALPMRRLLTRMLEPDPDDRFPDDATALAAVASGAGTEPWELALVPISGMTGSIVRTQRTPDALRIEVGTRFRPLSIVAGVATILLALAGVAAAFTGGIKDLRLVLTFALPAVFTVPHAVAEWRRRRGATLTLDGHGWRVEANGRTLAGPVTEPPLLCLAPTPPLEHMAFIASRAGLIASTGDESLTLGTAMLPAEAEAVMAAFDAALGRTARTTAVVEVDRTALVPATQRLAELSTPVRNPLRLAYMAVHGARSIHPDKVGFLPGPFTAKLERLGFTELGAVKVGLFGIMTVKQRVFTNEDGTVLVEAHPGSKGVSERGVDYHILSVVDAPRARYSWSHLNVTTPSDQNVVSVANQGDLEQNLTQHLQWLESQIAAGHLPVQFARIEDRVAYSSFYDRRLASARVVAIILFMAIMLISPLAFLVGVLIGALV